MSLPFSLPEYISKPKQAMKKAIQIECFGLSTDCYGGIQIDEIYWLEGHAASTKFYLIPMNPDLDIPYQHASFIADCIAYEHEIPIMAIPRISSFSAKDIPWYIKPSNYDKSDLHNIKNMYINCIRDASEMSETVSNGYWLEIIFKYDILECPTVEYKGYNIAKLDYIETYKNNAIAVHLYNTALKQGDPLSQYLCYFRVIENIQGNNSKEWIENVLANNNLIIDDYVWCKKKPLGANEDDLLLPEDIKPFLNPKFLYDSKGNLNLIELMRASSVYQISLLRANLTFKQIAYRLYNENRCGIAHGGKIKRHDFGDDFKDILNDLKLIKFLARYAIYENVN